MATVMMQSNEDKSPPGHTSNTLSRVLKYVSLRAVILFLMVAVGIFITIIIVNYGGYIDKIHQANINDALGFVPLGMRGASLEEVAQRIEQLRWAMEEAYGLHQPFLLRCVRWWYQTMTLDWGATYRIGIHAYTSGETPITQIVLERVPYTLLLAGATNIILFFASIGVALNLSKKHGGFMDRIIVALSPFSSIPNWIYGVILTVIFAGELHLLPFNGLYDTFPPATKLGYVWVVLRHMILPVTAIFLGMFFTTVYTWRTFFLIHAGEDYLETAKAKGLPDRVIERRYVLRPTLPFLITSFTIMIITFWQGIIVLEVYFDWPGLGQLFITSITAMQISITTAIVATFAFLLGISIFFLDIIYVFVDPRLKISGSSQSFKPVSHWKDRLSSLSSITSFLPSLDIRGRVDTLVNKSFKLASRLEKKVTRAVSPTQLTRIHSPGRIISQGSCPYLKLENQRAFVMQAPPSRCRCYLYDRPERIGSTFQAQVCRVVAYHNCPRLMPEPASLRSPATTVISSRQVKVRPKKQPSLPAPLKELLRYPAAVIGVAIIIALIGLSIYTVIKIPYQEAVQAWIPQTGDKYLLPKNAIPEWVNLFRKDPLPATIIQDSAKGAADKVFTPEDKGLTSEVITYTINYPYGGFPKDMLIVFDGQYEKKPFVILTWTTPDGREFNLGNFSAVSTQRYLISEDIPDKYVVGRGVSMPGISVSGTGGGAPPVQVLFNEPDVATLTRPLKGTYTLRIDTTLFEPNSNLDAEFVLYGEVYGLAGTDDMRRDLLVPLLWGTPIALAFGFLGAIATGMLSMVIAAVGVWFGGVVDALIQRLTEVNMILPVLPLAITIFYLYSKSIWMILGVIIILSIFGSSIKTYRSAFLQVKEAPYVEAALSYGASNWRIIKNYLVPRIIPLLIPQLVILVPSYVFFEATLAYLNVSDPALPTWGKVIYDAITRGIYHGYYYWVLEPVAMMILTGLAFAIVGFALDSILNPRLRRR
jgi:peptide/nickel transport system permease protein